LATLRIAAFNLENLDDKPRREIDPRREDSGDETPAPAQGRHPLPAGGERPGDGRSAAPAGPGAAGRGDAPRRIPKLERLDSRLRQSQLGSHRCTRPEQSEGEVENIGDVDLAGRVMMPCELTNLVFWIMRRALQTPYIL
jgi:hypothetical protein